MSNTIIPEYNAFPIYKSGSNNTPGPEFYDRGIEQTILTFVKTH